MLHISFECLLETTEDYWRILKITRDYWRLVVWQEWNKLYSHSVLFTLP